jgi:hypothetical protein
MNGGEEDESPWSEGSAQVGKSFAPHGGGNRRSSSEERDVTEGDAQLLEREGVRVRVCHGREKWAQPD